MNRPLLAILVVILTILASLGAVQVRFNSNPRFLLDDMEELDPTLKIWSEKFGNTDRQCQILVESEDCLAFESLVAVRSISNRLHDLDCVESVVSPLDVRGRRRVGRYLLPLIPLSLDRARIRRLRPAIESHPLIAGQLMSPDRRRLLIFSTLSASHQEAPELHQALDAVCKVLREETEGTAVRASLTGPPAIEVDIHREMQLDQLRFNVIGLSLASLVAVLVFRSFGSAFMAGAAPATGVFWTVGVMGFVGLDLNIMNSVLPLMILVIGYTDSVHILLHVRRSLRGGAAQSAAFGDALRTLWMPCLMTSLTTAASFASLLISNIPVLREFGLIGVIGCIVNFGAVFTILPLLGTTPLGRSLERKKEGTSPESAEPDDAERAGDSSGQGLLATVVQRLGRFAGRRHAIVSVVGILIVVFSVYVSTRLTPDNRIRYNLPASSDSFRAYYEIDQHFGGAMLIHTMVRWPESTSLEDERLLDAMLQIDDAFEKHPTVTAPLSILNVLKSLPSPDQSWPGPDDEGSPLEQDPLDEVLGKADALDLFPEDTLDQFYDRRSRSAVVMGHIPDCGTDRLMATLSELETELDRIRVDYPDIRIDMTGHTVVAGRLFSQLMSELGRSLLLAGAIIFVFLLLASRSLKLALLGVVPNAFALAATGAAIVLSGESFQYVSVLVFTICLGIAVDDTIHFIVRFQQLRKDGAEGADCPVQATVRDVGLPILISTVIFLVGFVTVSLSEIPTLRTFSWLACVSLSLALIGDVVLLPALIQSMRSFQNRNDGDGLNA